MSRKAKSEGEIAAESYIKNCKRFELKVDPSVVIALQTQWTILQPMKSFSEGAMLPLMEILEDDDHISSLDLSSTSMQDPRFRAAGNGNSNARVLNHILQKNSTIKTLDLSNTGLDDDGIAEICDGLQQNKTLTELNLSSNHFGEVGTDKLIAALQTNGNIKKLDVSRNALGFRPINALLCSCSERGMQVLTDGNFVFEEILNSVSHGIAFIISVVGANVLISAALDTYLTDYHFWACVVYSFALMFLFLASCLFHSFFMEPQTSRVLQVLDHVGIYLVIAGSMTPVFLIGLHHHTSAQVLLCAEWIAAFIGSVFAACSDLNAPATTLIELTIFISMGAGALLVTPLMLTTFCTPALVLLVGTLVTYCIGIGFFVMGMYKPIYHVVWHLFVIAAATLNWFAVYLFIVRTDLGAAAVMAGTGFMERGEAAMTAAFYNQNNLTTCTP